MHLPEPVGILAAAYHDAPRHMPPVTEQRYDFTAQRDLGTPRTVINTERPNRASDNEVYAMFEQTWGSTALGFGGIGGAAMSSAYTIIIFNGLNDYVVYFNGRAAYRVNEPNKKFFEDIAGRAMVAVGKSKVYE